MIIYFTESTSLYIYSAFLQANAAIIAILGLFIIYKIQSLQSSIDIIKSEMMRNQSLESHPKVIADFDTALINKKEEIYKDLEKQKSFYLPYFKIWLDNSIGISNLKNLITNPTIFLTTVIIIDGICLLICSNLHKYYKVEEVYLAYLVMLIHLILWIYICKTIINVIKQKKVV